MSPQLVLRNPELKFFVAMTQSNSLCPGVITVFYVWEVGAYSYAACEDGYLTIIEIFIENG